jgi:signal transduction histidine kinase
MEKTSHTLSYLSDQMHTFFESSTLPMFLTKVGSRDVLAYNNAFKEKECKYESFIRVWEKDYSQSLKRGSFLVEINHSILKFLTTELDNDVVLVQLIETDNTSDLSQERMSKIEQTSDSQKEMEAIFTGSRFKKIADLAPVGIIITDKNFKILWYNNSCDQLFGENHLLNQNFMDFIYIKDLAGFWSQFKANNVAKELIHFDFTINNTKLVKEFQIKCTGQKLPIDEEFPDGYAFILADNTDYLSFSEEITERNLELNQINHELDKFLYSVSHNIRGPVASLEGLLKVIDISDIKTVNELKHHLRLNLRLLNSFVHDISNVATNIHTHVKFQEINLHQTISEILLFMDNIYEITSVKKLNFDFNYTLVSDINRLAMVIKGVLKNSYQYRDIRKNNLELTVSVSQTEDFHLIEITDNGIGIDEKVMPKIFNMFYRGTVLSTGNGMGLYNSREFLKKIGGTMNIESQDRYWTKTKIYLPITA